MASHQELISEFPKVNNMSTDERLRYAQKRRDEQLSKWRDYENRLNQLNNGITSNHNGKKNKSVKFGDCITLLEAAARNDFDEVAKLLSANVNPNETNEDGLTALHQACIDNFEDIVELLLDHGADVNAVDSEFWTPLHAACTCGHTNIAAVLVNRGADLLALNADQNMPYDICEDDDALNFIEQAMAKKGITQEQINTARSTRENQIIKEVEAFVLAGGDIDQRDKVSATLLHVAAANGYVDLTRYILLNSTNFNVQDDDGWTPLHAAACWCQLEIVEILGSMYNADPTIKNKLGETPIANEETLSGQQQEVTEDAEVKTLLQKLLKMHKERKKPKVFSGLRRRQGGGGGSRVTGIRGQSFKGRSNRSKKNGISAVEAKAESEYWHKGQETSLDSDDDDAFAPSSPADDDVTSDCDTSDLKSTAAATNNNNWIATRQIAPGGNSILYLNGEIDAGDSAPRRHGVSKFTFGGKRFAKVNIGNGVTLSELKQRRGGSMRGNGADQLPIVERDGRNSDISETYSRLNGAAKRRSCAIL